MVKKEQPFIPEERFVIVRSGSHSETEIRGILDVFYETMPTLEKEIKRPLIILFDSKTGVYYTECHMRKVNLIGLVDENAEIDPDLQKDYRLNRSLKPDDADFQTMRSDAKKGRQFSDIVIEYTKDYRPEKPLKILGGQHRTKAVELESPPTSINGIKVYFALDKDKRAEIAKVSNTNIDISPDLLDRMEEQRLDPPNKLRDFAHEIGLLEKGKDFGDRKSNPEELPTVRLARTFITNFYKGQEYKDDFGSDALEGYLCSSSGMDEEYEKIYRKLASFVRDKDLMEVGRNFVKLHRKQYKVASSNKELKRTKAFRTKALSLAVVSAWAYTSGLLQRDQKRLENLYNLPVSSGKHDPLNARGMTDFELKPFDTGSYRGLGT